MNEFWPNLYIVGAPKCGTTSVAEYLRKHPQVFIPEMKEPHFFMTVRRPPKLPGDHCLGDLDAYQSLYRKANGTRWLVTGARATFGT